MRYGCGPRRGGLDPEHLAQERAERLTVPLRVAAAAPVAETDVEVAVGPEDEIAAVVVVVGLVDEQHLLARGRDGAVALHRVPHDPRIPVDVRVVHVEVSPVR